MYQTIGIAARLFDATREQVFKAFPAIASLTDKSDSDLVRIRGDEQSADGNDPSGCAMRSRNRSARRMSSRFRSSKPENRRDGFAFKS